jgi:hypothetical protein
MAFDVYVCIHAGSVVLVSSDKLLEVHAATRSRRVLSVLDTRGSEDEDEVQLGASNAARALLAALEVERGEDVAGGADRDELIGEKLRAHGFPSSTIRQVSAVLHNLEGCK